MKRLDFITAARLFFALPILCLAASCSSKGGDAEPSPSPSKTEPAEPTPSGSGEAQSTYEVTASPNPFMWVATDGQGNTIDPEASGYPDADQREGKYVGAFYFIWHGCHGYDAGANSNSVLQPSASDTESPYNIQELVDANPADPKWGGHGVMHHWGEPYLGYYLADDEWVIRKHAQMLTDAGVDVIIFDVTNGYSYIPVVKKIGDVYMQMREEGASTPQFMFLLNTNVSATFVTIYSEIYAKNLYPDLWFYWLGKPLMLANPDEVPANFAGRFTLRRSWYLWNNSSTDAWFGDGTDKWPWGGLYPQQAGKHSGKNECVSVMPATHPISNIGRSYDVNSGEPAVPQPEKGVFFKKQFERAMELDPSFLFFTGWNEWTAQRQIASQDGETNFLGHPVAKGGTYFVDQYNHEYSRDIEPMNGGFGDNYYYLLADFVRKYKGVKKLPVFADKNAIAIDGDMSDWEDVKALFGDDCGDTKHRSHAGWGRLGTLSNTTGRNDIALSKVATDGTNLYFYVKTADDMTPSDGADWMRLFIRTNANDASWEGFNFSLNGNVDDEELTPLVKSKGGWAWEEIGKVSYRVNKNEMEIAVPLEKIGIASPDAFTVEFKWIDNAASNGDIQTCMRDGDAAPNGRFRYRYTFGAN